MKAVLTVLGSGTSMGVPTIGCSCRVCHSSDPHDHRTRPSVLVEYDGRVVLIDTTPDFRQQAIREKITRLDAILYTHAHADHILGLDDVRPISFHGEGKIPLYAHDQTADALESIFHYIFDSNYKYGGIARVEMKRINGSLELFGARFDPVKIIHGDATIHGFRFGSAAYLTDFSEIPPESKERLRGLDILFLDALRHRPHPTHSTVANSLSLVEELKPRRAFFTHISHDLPHEETNRNLPEHVRLAHDGLKLEFEIA
ncbi:MAG TPA: MBL fold metallo-hydrolase [Candidatus Angelobacter sp.]|nr:MBL fold metallo-hydrolase [Candidatus Angelobacter sp.]